MSGNSNIVCTECGTENPGRYAFCFSCGSSLPVPERVPPEEVAEPVPALIACPKCETANPEEYQYCAHCGGHLRPQAKPRRDFGVPLALGIIGGLVAAAYSYTHGALPTRVVFSAMFGFAFWWALAALVAWLLRPCWRRAAAVGASVLLIVIVGAAYIVTQAWTGQDLAYIDMPTPTAAHVEATVASEARPVPTSTRWLATPPPVSDACLPWQAARFYVGQYKCVCGHVHHVQNIGDAFFIHFDEGNEAFYAFSRDYYWNQGMLEGKCVLICGTVEANYGRPRIMIDDPDEQVYWCR